MMRRAEKRQHWRLKKTLARQIDVRPMDDGDLKYLWAAYKKGGLAALGERFADPDMNAEEFRAAFDAVSVIHDDGWVISADTARGRMPVGAVFGSLAPMAAYMIVTGIAWFPWASKRNIVEGTVAFFNAIRRQIPTMGYAIPEHKRLYEVCCMHGVMQRIGTSRVVFPGQSAAVFETRPP